MFKKNKYDILIKDLKGASKTLVLMYWRLNSVTKNVIKGKISDEQYEEIKTHLLRNIYPILIVSAHVGYENYKDIESINKNELYNYLNKRGISVVSFFNDYYAKLKLMCRMLATLSILEKENIPLPEISDTEVAMELLGGKNMEEVFAETLDQVSEESKMIVSEVFDDNFDARHISEQVKETIDNYHNSYMDEFIYPRVTKEISKEKQIIKNAEKISRRM